MRALIISVDLGDPDFLAHAEEFAMLAKGAGAEIVGTLTARRDRPDAKFFIGSGKADEGVGMAQALLADIVLFDQPCHRPSSATWKGCSTCAWSTGSR